MPSKLVHSNDNQSLNNAASAHILPLAPTVINFIDCSRSQLQAVVLVFGVLEVLLFVPDGQTCRQLRRTPGDCLVTGSTAGTNPSSPTN